MAQWISLIGKLTQKGVKGNEIEDSNLLPTLELRDPKQSLTREELMELLVSTTPTIKEIDLGRPKYAGFKQPGPSVYQETLYVLNSQKANIEDRMDEIRFELEELDFDLDRLARDPGAVVRLDAERRALLASVGKAHDFSAHHFSDMEDPERPGQKIANLLAHARTTVRGDLFMIEEIQSDWAQRGRRQEWTGIAKGPFVTNTEVWSGLVLRRTLQRAAEDPAIRRVGWITANMRNGWNNERQSDGLNDFYLKILPKIAEKALKGSDQKIRMTTVQFQENGPEHSVPGFDMTPQAREVLLKPQPMYSRDALRHTLAVMNDDLPEYQRAYLTRAHEMLGSVASVRLASHIYDAAGMEVAGSQLNRMILLSSRAKEPDRVFYHECWHYAQEHLIEPKKNEAIDRAFQAGSPLHTLTVKCLAKKGLIRAAAQCNNPRETAAHAFSLWKTGALALPAEETPGSSDVADSFTTVGRTADSFFAWMQRVSGEAQIPGDASDVQIVAAVFAQLAAGDLAEQREDDPDDDQQGADSRPRMR
ncbi:hypothetical protein K2O51_31440 (plasmid) [Cupriavidus pinatubonensis]|uniref:hypothetical protein n=1 Tax=Cupriavidus pinatubonensis TaxID=248026 RepID=UPI001C73836A|nr:hypothetical protein [Cupriavidus pinatubonensis]QYY33547.1 hypothetical protein K2O51_31440 [Cupriavidus pinatubonensis]